MMLDDHKGLIERLIPVYGSDDFDYVFQMMTEGEDAPTRLQIKMELHRIMAPCYQIVDLRGKVNGECRPYVLNGLQHWLDDVAINTYHKRIKHFDGTFRVGLYEALMNTHNNFRVMHQQKKQHTEPSFPITTRDTQFDTPLLRFGHYLTRNENRLQISTPVNLTLHFGQEVHGVTSDLSYSGAKFKVPAAFRYNLGMKITAYFPKLADKLHLHKQDQGVTYRILAIDESQENDSFKWLRVKIISDNSAIKAAIDEALAQHRARHNYEDKVIQVRTRGFEHCYLKHSSGMPLFFAGTTLKYSLLTQHNRHLWEYWHDERNQPVINHLFSHERIAGLGQPGLKQSSTLIYCFSHDYDNKTYFYSAAQPEMNGAQRHLFWHIGAQRGSWRVLRLTLQPIEPDDIERLNDIAPEMVDQLSSLTHVGQLQDLTNREAQQDYRRANKSQLTSNALQEYRHPRNPIATAKTIYFDPKPQRSEDRFLFTTPIRFHASEHTEVAGNSIDFSPRGLNLTLQAPLQLCRNDEVTISFPLLQKANKNAPLSRVPYKVVRVSPDYCQIQLTTGTGARAVKSEHFLRKLILNNDNKLVMAEERLPQGELLMAMHQMLLNRLNCVPYFAEKVDHKVKLKALGCNFPHPPLVRLFNQIAENKGYSLEPLFRHRIKRMLAETMRPVEIRQPFVHELYLWVQRKDNKLSYIEAKLFDEFSTTEARIQFINHAKCNGEFMAIRVTAVPVQRPMTALIGQELGDLARLTLHRARALENELSSLIGCGELYDITDEVLNRLEIK